MSRSKYLSPGELFSFNNKLYRCVHRIDVFDDTHGVCRTCSCFVSKTNTCKVIAGLNGLVRGCPCRIDDQLQLVRMRRHKK